MSKKQKQNQDQQNQDQQNQDQQEPLAASVVEKVSDTDTFFEGMVMRTIITLNEPGDGIKGVFLGASDDEMIVDGDEKRPVKTWALRVGNGTVIRLMGSTILDKQLSQIEPETEIAILRGQTVQRGSRQLTYWQVAMKPH